MQSRKGLQYNFFIYISFGSFQLSANFELQGILILTLTLNFHKLTSLNSNTQPDHPEGVSYKKNYKQKMKKKNSTY